MTFVEKKRFQEMLQSNPFYNYLGWRTVEDAKSLVNKGQVSIVAHTDTTIEGRVTAMKNPNEAFTVHLQAYGSQLLTSCNCKDGAQRKLCRHVCALAIAGRDLFSEEIKKSWENRLQFVHETRAVTSSGPRQVDDYLLAFALFEEYQSWAIKPLTAPLKKLPAGVVSPGMEWTPQLLSDLITYNYPLRSAFSLSKIPAKDSACVNAPPDLVSLARLLMSLSDTSSSSYYSYTATSSSKALAGTLEILRERKIPLFKGTSYHSASYSLGAAELLTISPDAARVLLDIENIEDGSLRLQFHLFLGNALWRLTKNPVVISSHPLWLLVDDSLIPAEEELTVEHIENLRKASRLIIPAAEKQTFIENYLPRLATQFEITGGAIRAIDLVVRPQPRLYLNENQGMLEVWLRYGYGDFEVPYASRIPKISSVYQQETTTFVRIFRDEGAERLAFSNLGDFGLKRVTGTPGLFNLRAKVDVVDFLMRYVPKATAAGYEVYGEENIKNVRINRYQPKVSFNVTSGIDWFDVQTVIQYGDQDVSLKEMRRAMKQGQRYIKLADGTMGEVPEEWLERFKHLFALGEETDAGLRYSAQQVTLLDEMLTQPEQVRADEEFQRRRQQLRSIGQVTPQALPHGLEAVLRPYQKAGYDWLHFLRQVQFGGILADDMGLGKTVQVLALLQSLYETDPPPKPSLVVAPRSLLVNWQREAEKFTPSLRILEYHGQLREKDPAAFEPYHVILTTYGIVLRDIKLLHDYRFEYAILDESQAIKNPLSQSAKACRLLQANHRLVMTGTPVENSTFELWSQFAFVSPGLLGGLEYFKREFAAPIERDVESDASGLLRKLVYPFILRRTKEQVAPELPPRTERIIYGEMEPAQAKIYARTREYYRKTLLGLIDGEGIENARMKILEGLLRLRQVCIHPKLIEPGHRGESAKFELLLEHIETLLAEGHKALIFSQFVETLKLLRAELDQRKISYAYLDGSTRNRQEQVDRFQSDAALPFFLISLKAGGVGLNLTAADYVIHIDPWWNPAVEMQASDRAHRIGQEKPVFIYKYILRDTVEEKILQLQERKKSLVEQIIAADAQFFKNITAEDVRALFS